MFRTLVAAAVVASLAGPAYSQSKGKEKSALDLKYEQEQRVRDEVAKEYEATMRRTRSNTPSAATDPWASVRPAQSSKRPK